MTKYYGVIGNPIEHSLSPEIHQAFAEQTNCSLHYRKILGDEHGFEEQVQDFFNTGGSGLNVTLPFKIRAFAMASWVSPRCQAARAANTLWREKGLLCADNTDGIGLIRDVQRYCSIANKDVLIVGAGGAARSIIPALLALSPATLTITNRTPQKALALKEAYGKSKKIPVLTCRMEALSRPYDLILNATSASLWNQPVLLNFMIQKNRPFCYDLAYRRGGETEFVRKAKSKGLQAIDGLGMLVEQAAESFLTWHKIKPHTISLLETLRNTQ